MQYLNTALQLGLPDLKIKKAVLAVNLAKKDQLYFFIILSHGYNI